MTRISITARPTGLRRAPPRRPLHITNPASVQLFAADLLIPAGHAARYLLETLSPQAVNAFPLELLRQRPPAAASLLYVFEDTAERLLDESPTLRLALDSARAERDLSARAQLDFIYRRSPHSEGTAGRYPVFRIPAGQSLPFRE